MCASTSLSLSYLILGVLVSARSQQELHSCGLTVDRGINERSGATLNIEAHTIVAKREEGRRMREVREVEE